MSATLRETIVFLALTSVVFFSFGFLILALAINRQSTKQDQQRPLPRSSTPPTDAVP